MVASTNTDVNFIDGVQPMNPGLHKALVAAYTKVRIHKPGDVRKVIDFPDPQRPGFLKSKTLQHGEQYQINCPFCGDDRQRCYVKYQFGIRDHKGRNLHLFFCQRRRCHEEPHNQQQLYNTLQKHGYSASSARIVAPPAANTVPASARTARLPAGLLPLHFLPPEHHALAYLQDRGFDPSDVSVRYDVCYCPEDPESKPRVKDRLVIPIYMPDPAGNRNEKGHSWKLVGWQARAIDEGGHIKYLSAEGFRKTECLYGLAEALGTNGPVIVCEGVTDVWRIGPGAVALFGKSLSSDQLQLLKRHFAGRPVVVLLDPDASSEGVKMVETLRRDSAFSAVVLGRLPQECTDPGDCQRKQIWANINEQLNELPGVAAGPRYHYRVVDFRKWRLKTTGLKQLGDLVVVKIIEPAVPEDAAPAIGKLEPALALVGANTTSRYVPRGAKSLLRTIGDRRRLYYNALAQRQIELRHGLPVSLRFDDIHLAALLLKGGDTCDLDELAIEILPPSEIPPQVSAAAPSAREAECAVREAVLAQRIWNSGRLQQQLQAQGLDFVYREIELPVVAPVAKMLHHGLRVDDALLARRQSECDDVQREAQLRVEELVGHPVDLKNPDDLQHLLFEELKIEPQRLGKAEKPTLDKEHLAMLVNEHPVVEQILRWKESKTLSQHLDGLVKAPRTPSGRIRCELDPLGTDTGRFNCREPNLQGLMRRAREVIVAEEGFELLEADYSQAEFRVLAQLSQDPSLVAAYVNGTGDLHRRTAAILFGVPEDQVTSDQRQKGKQTNFAILYGQTAHGLAEKLAIAEDEAQQLIDGFWAAYPVAKSWADETVAVGKMQGFACSLYGRRRKLPDLASENPNSLQRAERQAINTTIQATAADIFKLALARLHSRLPAACRLLMVVHDSVLLEIPEKRVDEVVVLVRKALEELPPQFKIPLPVDIHVGRNWAQCKDDSSLLPKAKPARRQRRAKSRA